jgi:hypothetical protein
MLYDSPLIVVISCYLPNDLNKEKIKHMQYYLLTKYVTIFSSSSFFNFRTPSSY